MFLAWMLTNPWILIGIVIVCIVIWIRVLRKSRDSSYDKRNATFYVADGDRVLSSATGSMADEALRILCSKLYAQVQSLTKPEAVQSRINQMYSAINNARGIVPESTIDYCSRLLIRAKEKHRRLCDEKMHRVENENRSAIEKQNTHGKEADAHKRMIAEQRRLMTDSLRYDILARDGFRCKICGASAADGAKLHVDHIIPVSKGGKTEKANLRTLCERCNLGKSNKIENVPVPAVPTKQIKPQLPAPEDVPEESHDLPLSKVEQLLTDSGIRYVDNTGRGGCFWIELTSESKALLNGKTIDGRKIYIAKSSKAFPDSPAFFIK